MLAVYNGDAGTPCAADAPLDDRIRSVWPYLMKRVVAFQKTLNVVERVAFDHEDTMSELCLELTERDRGYDPAKGRYITFAGFIVEHHLVALRERSRVVQSPKNVGYRLKEYEVDEVRGKLSAVRARTADDMRRTVMAPEVIDAVRERALVVVDPDGCEPLDVVVLAEEHALSRAMIVRGICVLEPLEAFVLGRLHGLWGQPVVSSGQLVAESGMSRYKLRTAQAAAYRKIREHLEESRKE